MSSVSQVANQQVQQAIAGLSSSSVGAELFTVANLFEAEHALRRNLLQSRCQLGRVTFDRTHPQFEPVGTVGPRTQLAPVAARRARAPRCSPQCVPGRHTPRRQT